MERRSGLAGGGPGQGVERCLDLVPWRAKALHQAGVFAWEVWDLAPSISLLEESLALHRALGDEHSNAHILRDLAWAFWRKGDLTKAGSLLAQGITQCRQLDGRSGLALALLSHGRYAAEVERDYETARERAAEVLSLAQGIGDLWLLARAFYTLAFAAFVQGDYAAAQSVLEENLASVRKLKDRSMLGLWLAKLGDVAYAQGHYERSGDYWEQALRPLQESGDVGNAAVVRRRLGLVALHQGRLEEARAHLTEALVRHRETGVTILIVSGVAEWAGLAEKCGQHERAARLLAAAEAILEANDLSLLALSRVIHERNVAAVRTQLDEARFSAAWAEGRAMTLEQAVEYALQEPDEEW